MAYNLGVDFESVEWEQKTWGETFLFSSSDRHEHHLLRVERGGYSSIHYHEDRANLFIVRSGVIVVAEWRSPVDVAIHTLGADNTLEVPSRVPHAFAVLESGACEEVYWGDRGGLVRHSDIVRLCQGGKLSDPDSFKTVAWWATLATQRF